MAGRGGWTRGGANLARVGIEWLGSLGRGRRSTSWRAVDGDPLARDRKWYRKYDSVVDVQQLLRESRPSGEGVVGERTSGSCRQNAARESRTNDGPVRCSGRQSQVPWPRIHVFGGPPGGDAVGLNRLDYAEASPGLRSCFLVGGSVWSGVRKWGGLRLRGSMPENGSSGMLVQGQSTSYSLAHSNCSALGWLCTAFF